MGAPGPVEVLKWLLEKDPLCFDFLLNSDEKLIDALLLLEVVDLGSLEDLRFGLVVNELLVDFLAEIGVLDQAVGPPVALDDLLDVLLCDKEVDHGECGSELR